MTEAHPRHRRLTIVAAVLALLAFLTFLALRPAPLFGISAGALSNSVGGSGLGLGLPQGCRTIDDGEWRCTRHDDQFSSTVSYRVRVDGMGCWSANRFGPPGEGSPAHLSGCLHATDYLFG